jgi:hypothetical protein
MIRSFIVFETILQRLKNHYPVDIQLFQLRLSPERSGKVEYERERRLGIANK